MRCLVTGATGHLGAALVRLLLAEGHHVTALVRPSSDTWRIADLLPRLDLITGDLADVSRCTSRLRDAAPETVFHLGWQGVSGDELEDRRHLRPNLVGTLGLLETLAGGSCRVWIGVGSQAEYGPASGPIGERQTCRPTSLYGATKLATGWVTLAFCQGAAVRCVWLRIFATYGPADHERHLIPYVVTELIQGRRPLLSTGEQRWDYLYVEDAVRALYRAAVLPGVDGFFNLGSGRAETVRWIAEHLRDLIDPALPLGFGEKSAGPSSHLEADTIAFRDVAQWVPEVGLEEGLERTVDWYRRRMASSATPGPSD